MISPGPGDSRTRIRAAKACQRCSQRKIKCDAAACGLPCGRCRSDGVQDCTLRSSRRGCYQRKERPSATRKGSSKLLQATTDRFSTYSPTSPAPRNNAISGSHESEVSYQNHAVVDSATTEFPPESRSPARYQTRSFAWPSPRLGLGAADRDRPVTDVPTVATATGDGIGIAPTPRSLPSMFEDFLRRQGVSSDTVTEKCGFVLLSETSPLTFALEGVQMDRHQGLSGDDPQPVMDRTSEQATEHTVAGSPLGHHPSHMTPDDIVFLQSRGAFDTPEPKVLDALVHAFTTRFYPLYSIVDIEEFESLYRQQKIPWILLHAVCLIGATFCDATVIHQSPFKRRWEARRAFYDRTKTLFDIGYETNKTVLLQSVLMLTFWGPHLKSYWNPSTWVDFATTIAASLGIHRNSGLARFPPKDRGLLRRLWSIVLARDASSATLLGRPFRIRISQCDTDTLSCEDFPQPSSGLPLHALYQIHSSKLSLILRHIVQFHSNGDNGGETQSSLHATLTAWKHDLPAEIDWNRQNDQKNIFANSLKIIYHHHVILIYMGKVTQALDSDAQASNTTSLSIEPAIVAAQTIASSALSLMLNSNVSSMPHEIYTGFFIAGVVFYRQIRQEDSQLAQLKRSALDNCQMILNEARESCDAAQWMMRVFDFLLSCPPEQKEREIQAPNSPDASATAEHQETGCAPKIDYSFSDPDLNVDATEWGGSTLQDHDSLPNDFFFLPDFYMPAFGDFSYG